MNTMILSAHGLIFFSHLSSGQCYRGMGKPVEDEQEYGNDNDEAGNQAETWTNRVLEVKSIPLHFARAVRDYLKSNADCTALHINVAEN